MVFISLFVTYCIFKSESMEFGWMCDERVLGSTHTHTLSLYWDTRGNERFEWNVAKMPTGNLIKEKTESNELDTQWSNGRTDCYHKQIDIEY